MKYYGYIGFERKLFMTAGSLSSFIATMENRAQGEADLHHSPKAVNIFSEHGTNVASFLVHPKSRLLSIPKATKADVQKTLKPIADKQSDDAPITEKEGADQTVENLFAVLKYQLSFKETGHMATGKWSAHYYKVPSEFEIIRVYSGTGVAFRMRKSVHTDGYYDLSTIVGFQPLRDIHHAYKLLGLC